MKYGFYSLADPGKEFITIHEYPDIIQAINSFAAMKALPLPTFLELFAVVKITENGNYK